MAAGSPCSITPNTEPHVGIFFYIAGTLHIESTPISRAENRGNDFLIHPGDHASYWETDLKGTIPEHRTKSYDFFPRGRTAYSVTDKVFLLHHDICIPRERIAEVMKILNLPIGRTHIDLDSHYRCAACNGDYVSDSIWELD
jgi:hypothetical protein